MQIFFFTCNIHFFTDKFLPAHTYFLFWIVFCTIFFQLLKVNIVVISNLLNIIMIQKAISWTLFDLEIFKLFSYVKTKVLCLEVTSIIRTFSESSFKSKRGMSKYFFFTCNIHCFRYKIVPALHISFFGLFFSHYSFNF